MSLDNPLLIDTDLPDFAHFETRHVQPAIEKALSDHRTLIEAISSRGAQNFDSVVLASERADFHLSRTWSPIDHLASVADTPDLREAHSRAEADMTAYLMEAGQNRAHHDSLKQLADSNQFALLSSVQKRAVELALRGFRLAGVALEGDARQRFLKIGIELSDLSTKFANAVLDATESWTEHVTDEAELVGLSQDDKAILSTYARERDLPGWLIRLRQPSLLAILLNAKNRSLRERVYRANVTRASDQSDEKQYDNSQRLERILSLRHEAAQILGFADTAARSLETKMAADAGEALNFLVDLARRARPVAEQELKEAKVFAAEHLDLNDLQAWDLSFVAEAMRRRLHGIDQQALKPYFPLPKVLEGTQMLIQRLFNVELRIREDASVWHSDVIFFDVIDSDGAVIAGVYLDLFARAGKRGGAWMDVCRARFRDADRFHRPIAYLTTNFAPGGDGRPSLLNHNDIVTLFHEFGHVLHHLLTDVDLPSIGGIAGVEWDAVELPSQFMENFAWDRATLIGLSGHVETGASLPGHMFDRLLAARHFQAGMAMLRQIEFAMFDLMVHRDYDPCQGAQIEETLAKVRNAVAVIRPPSWNRFAHSFTHIFAGGYAAGYYSYLWAELLSADAFELFSHADVPGGGASAFRREILSVGASRPAAESFLAFAGRPPQVEALLRARGIAA